MYILFKNVSIFIDKFLSIKVFSSLRNKFPKMQYILTWPSWSNPLRVIDAVDHVRLMERNRIDAAVYESRVALCQAEAITATEN